jgi:DNA-binding protein H-NS
VARQVAVRSVVKSFGKLSFEQQKDALVQLHDQHELARSAKRAELERQLSELGYRAPKKLGRPKAVKKAKANGAAPKKANGAARKNGKKSAVKAKYRDGKTGDTWSGRGRMATWLKSKQEAGEKIEKYLLN